MMYQWNGEIVKAQFGYCTVEEVKDKPLWWWNYNVLGLKSKIIPAVRVSNVHYAFVIANHFGMGEEKLRLGGWPNFPYWSLPIDTFIETNHQIPFNNQAYSDYYERAKAWFEQHCHDLSDYVWMKDLRSILKNRLKEVN